MKKTEAEVDTTWKDFFVGVLYFGWPSQPSSGTMRILHWYVIFMLHVKFSLYLKKAGLASRSIVHLQKNHYNILKTKFKEERNEYVFVCC